MTPKEALKVIENTLPDLLDVQEYSNGLLVGDELSLLIEQTVSNCMMALLHAVGTNWVQPRQAPGFVKGYLTCGLAYTLKAYKIYQEEKEPEETKTIH